jgi:hypothetical protein
LLMLLGGGIDNGSCDMDQLERAIERDDIKNYIQRMVADPTYQDIIYDQDQETQACDHGFVCCTQSLVCNIYIRCR